MASCQDWRKAGERAANSCRWWLAASVECGEFVGDVHVAGPAAVVEGDRDGSGVAVGDDAGVADVAAGGAVNDHPRGRLAVGVGLEDGSWCGVVGSRCRKVRVPLQTNDQRED